MMPIIRVNHSKDNPYVLIDKRILADKGLDLQSKGLLTFLLSKPDNWQVIPKALAGELPETLATIYRVLKKIKEAGYIDHVQDDIRLPSGRIQRMSMYTVFESKGECQEWVDMRKFNRVANS